MKFQIRKCQRCQKYTLLENCKKCSEKTNIVHPAKFSPDDKYSRYRNKENYQ